MTVSENLLFQMYQMMDSVKLPEVNTSSSGKESEKNSFQDLMDQTRENAAKSEASTQDKDEVNQTKQPNKTTENAEKTASKSTRTEEDQPKLEDSNYIALSYLLRPEISMVPDEVVEQVAQQPLVTTVEGENIVQTLIPTETTAAQENLVPTQQSMDTAESLIPAELSQDKTLVQPETQQSQFTQTMQTETEKADLLNRADTAPTNTHEDESEVLISSDTSAQPLFHEAESTPIKVGENYQLDTTSPEMDVELTRLIDDAAVQGLQKLEIQLTPEHLGKIVVELTQNSDGILQVVIHAANAKSSGLLSQHLDSLNSALQNLGHNQVHVEVERNQDGSSAQQHPFQQADPDGRGQHQEQRQHKQSQSDSDDFLQQLRLGLFSLDESI